ncbi:hypothetical protein EMEDMD4_1310034 [Sinorhizobium medicae]|uniref:Uncharacterized protein n=1 Tax=Sinorhizobium medicae TaxID=110321 RepID=A0A508WRC0_9HYPH|nr:hypothetical protein EMEDMD4_1310034 [Sinorhizobium medicae]
MQKLSIMMLSVRMSYEFDEAKGRTVGSVIKMRGNILGLVLSVEEAITEPAATSTQGMGDARPPEPPCRRCLPDGVEISGPRGCACSSTTIIRRRSRQRFSVRCLDRSTHAGALIGWPRTRLKAAYDHISAAHEPEHAWYNRGSVRLDCPAVSRSSIQNTRRFTF